MILRIRTMLVVILTLLAAPVAADDRASEFVICHISERPTDEMKKCIGFADYLAQQLKDQGIARSRVVIARSITEAATFFEEGKIDVLIDSPFPALAVGRLSGAQPILRRWKGGIGEYHSVLFTRKDSGIEKSEQLKGRMIAFEDPFSSSGYYLPKLLLTEKQLKVNSKRETTDTVRRNEVGYVFSEDEQNTMVWVLAGKVAAGAMDHQTYVLQARERERELRVIEKSYELPRHLVVVRKELPAALAAAFKQALLDMDKSEAGRKALASYEKTSRFDAIPDSFAERIPAITAFTTEEFDLPDDAEAAAAAATAGVDATVAEPSVKAE